MQNSRIVRRVIGALVAIGVLAALVCPTSASPIVRKTHRAVVDASSTAASVPILAGDADGHRVTALWLIEPFSVEQNSDRTAGFCPSRGRTRALDVLTHSAFGSRPPPYAV